MAKKSFVKGAAILGIAGLIVKFIGVFYRIPLANIVGVEGMSYYEVVFPYYNWLLVISSSGLPTAISKMVAERVSLNDTNGAKAVFKSARKLLFFIGILTSLIMFVLAQPLANMTGLSEASLSFRALAPALFFVSMICAYRGYLQGLQLMTGTAVSQVIEQVVKLGAGIVLANYFMQATGKSEYAAMGALLGVMISEVIALIAIIVFYLKHRNKLFNGIDSYAVKSRYKTSSSIMRTLISTAVPITIGASIMPLGGIIDSSSIINILVNSGHSLDTAKAAFSILRTNVNPLINIPAVLTVALAMSLVPAISSHKATNDIKGVKIASRMGMKLALIIGLPCAVGLFVMGRPIIGLLFTRLTDAQLNLAQDLMHTASIGVIFLSLVQAQTGIIQGLGKPRVPVLNLAFGAILKVITMLTLMRIPSVNIQGAAISTVVCYAASGIMDTVCVIRFAHLKINIYDVFIKPTIASLIMGVIVSLIYKLLSSTGHITVATFIAIAVGIIVYAILFFALKMMSKNELDYMPGGGRIKRLMYKNESTRR